MFFLASGYKIAENRRAPVRVISSTTSDARQLISDRHIRDSMPLWWSIAVLALTLTLSPLPSATVFAQASSTDKVSDQKSGTIRKDKARRARSKAKSRKGAGRSPRGNQAMRRKKNEPVGAQSNTSGRATERNRKKATRTGSDDSARPGNENDKHSMNQEGATEHGEQTIDSAIKPGMAQRSNRMEFDARLIYGETAGSGAVILFERGQRYLPPLTKQRTKFLAATTEPILGKKVSSRSSDRSDDKKDKLEQNEKKLTIDGLRN